MEFVSQYNWCALDNSDQAAELRLSYCIFKWFVRTEKNNEGISSDDSTMILMMSVMLYIEKLLKSELIH